MAVKMEMTKGYGIIVGKVYGIEGKEPRKNDYLSELRIRVKTSNDHTVWVKVGGFFSSRLNVKLKGKGMEEAEEYSLGEVADVLQDYFTDGDDVLIRCGVEVNPYKDGSLDLVAYGIYSCKDPIDFESKDFEERNNVSILTEKDVAEWFMNLYRNDYRHNGTKVNAIPSIAVGGYRIVNPQRCHNGIPHMLLSVIQAVRMNVRLYTGNNHIQISDLHIL